MLRLRNLLQSIIIYVIYKLLPWSAYFYPKNLSIHQQRSHSALRIFFEHRTIQQPSPTTAVRIFILRVDKPKNSTSFFSPNHLYILLCGCQEEVVLLYMGKYLPHGLALNIFFIFRFFSVSLSLSLSLYHQKKKREEQEDQVEEKKKSHSQLLHIVYFPLCIYRVRKLNLRSTLWAKVAAEKLKQASKQTQGSQKRVRKR